MYSIRPESTVQNQEQGSCYAVMPSTCLIILVQFSIAFFLSLSIVSCVVWEYLVIVFLH